MLEALLAAIFNLILNIISTLGYLGVFLLMIPGGANIPIPSEIILPFAGFLTASGELQFWSVVLIGVLGDLTGALISYSIAKRIDSGISKKRNFKTAERFFQKFGEAAIFLGRILPVIRTFIAFPAGLFKVRLWRFIVLSLAGSLIWVTFLVYAGFILGDNWTVIEPYFKKFNYLIVVLLIIGFIWWLRRHTSKDYRTKHEE